MRLIHKIFILFLFSCSIAYADFDLSYLTHPSGQKIRIGRYKTDKINARTILICPGRSSFIEKNETAAKIFNDMGFNVVVLDWRGQGGSDRLINHAQKVYIKNYNQYLDDIDLVIKNLKPEEQSNLFFYGASMGGHVALRYLAQRPHQIKAAVLAAPMLDVQTSPFPKFLARFLGWFKTKTGHGGSYCYGFGNFNPNRDVFERNKVTHDPVVFERQRQLALQYPKLVTGGPTFRWLHASFESIDQLKDPNFLKNIKIPVLIASAGDDRFVDNSQDVLFSQQLLNGQHTFYEGSFHHILYEKPEISDKFKKDMEVFFKNVS